MTKILMDVNKKYLYRIIISINCTSCEYNIKHPPTLQKVFVYITLTTETHPAQEAYRRTSQSLTMGRIP